MFIQTMSFDWLPWKCKGCWCFGHSDDFCPKKPKVDKEARGKHGGEEARLPGRPRSDRHHGLDGEVALVGEGSLVAGEAELRHVDLPSEPVVPMDGAPGNQRGETSLSKNEGTKEQGEPKERMEGALGKPSLEVNSGEEGVDGGVVALGSPEEVASLVAMPPKPPNLAKGRVTDGEAVTKMVTEGEEVTKASPTKGEGASLAKEDSEGQWITPSGKMRGRSPRNLGKGISEEEKPQELGGENTFAPLEARGDMEKEGTLSGQSTRGRGVNG